MKIDDEHFRDIECNCWDPQSRISEIEHTGVTAQVISTVPVMFNYDKTPEHCLHVSRYLIRL
jgi:aminocarboxymuconate-semialdehyde decarboxylase